jgi:hypothetical protein
MASKAFDRLLLAARERERDLHRQVRELIGDDFYEFTNMVDLYRFARRLVDGWDAFAGFVAAYAAAEAERHRFQRRLERRAPPKSVVDFTTYIIGKSTPW